MSCRVITTGMQAQLERLAFPRHGERPESIAQTDAAPAKPAAGQPDPANARYVAELHNRILQLERALEQEVRRAHETGLREGERLSAERFTAEVQPQIDRLARSIAETASLRCRIRREAEADLVTLAISIARRVLRRELSVDPDAVQGLVKAALEKIQLRDACRVRIHPSHERSVRKHLEGAGASAEIVGDPALQPGDVLIETKRGDLDASIETQLSEIERGFADRLRGGQR